MTSAQKQIIVGDQTFCVYEHWRPDKGICFYVGKGKPKRVKRFERKENERHLRILEKLAKRGLRTEVKIIASGVSEDIAFALEKERIAYWGSGLL
jgi:hypothetical protein